MRTSSSARWHHEAIGKLIVTHQREFKELVRKLRKDPSGDVRALAMLLKHEHAELVDFEKDCRARRVSLSEMIRRARAQDLLMSKKHLIHLKRAYLHRLASFVTPRVRRRELRRVTEKDTRRRNAHHAWLTRLTENHTVLSREAQREGSRRGARGREMSRYAPYDGEELYDFYEGDDSFLDRLRLFLAVRQESAEVRA